jgi:hypothetical protein
MIQSLANITPNAPNLALTDQWTLRRLYPIIKISKGNDLLTIKSCSSFRFPTSHKLLITLYQKKTCFGRNFLSQKGFFSYFATKPRGRSWYERIPGAFCAASNNTWLVHNEVEGKLKETVVAYHEAGQLHIATGESHENGQSQQMRSLSCAIFGISRSRFVNYVTTKHYVLCKRWLMLDSYQRWRNRTFSSVPVDKID